MAKFRQTKTGEWVAFADFSEVHGAKEVVIWKKNGDKVIREIDRLGKPFEVGARTMVYAYLVPDRPTPGRRCNNTSRNSSKACENCERTVSRTYTAYDSSGIAGQVCGDCSREDSYSLSFA